MTAGRPTDTMLEAYAPLSVWQHTERMARRSNLFNHRTGAVIFGTGGEIIGEGWSHRSDSLSIHAEQMALNYLPAARMGACDIVIVTITKANNFSYSSRPCARCSIALSEGIILDALYPARANDGTWSIARDDCQDLRDTALMMDTNAQWARHMRVV